MKNGKSIECTTLDTQYNNEKEECIKVTVKPPLHQSSGEVTHVIESLIPLNKIATLEVLIENPHFTFVSFLP
jgi:hypothetical protein